MALNDARDDCETHTRPRVVLGGVKALKDAKESTRVLGVKSDSIVAHEKDNLTRFAIAANFNVCDGAGACELARWTANS